MEPLRHLFAHVCGQNPGHLWAPGGVPLPCCERCTGFYAGVLVVLGAVWLARPPRGAGFFRAHLLCLLALVPAGLGWIEEGPCLRTAAGMGFGFGVAGCLLFALGDCTRDARAPRRSRPGAYPLLLAGGLVAVPFLGACGGLAGGAVLTLLAPVGALAAALLGLASVSALIPARH